MAGDQLVEVDFARTVGRFAADDADQFALLQDADRRDRGLARKAGAGDDLRQRDTVAGDLVEAKGLTDDKEQDLDLGAAKFAQPAFVDDLVGHLEGAGHQDAAAFLAPAFLLRAQALAIGLAARPLDDVGDGGLLQGCFERLH